MPNWVLSITAKNSSNEKQHQQIIKGHENVLGNPAQQAQHTFQSPHGSMGDFQQRGCNSLLPHKKAEPQPPGNAKGAKSVLIV
jgi:hypothetical protein